MRLLPGLCSVALRHLDPEDVVACAVAGRAVGIEWEARVHVPPGDVDKARHAADLTAIAGLAIPSYGAYARAGSAGCREEFSACLISAEALGAPMVRVWTASTEGLSAAGRNEAVAGVAADLADFCDQAAGHGKTVSLEFHPGTFTEGAGATLQLVDRVARPNLRSHWQPDYGQPLEDASNSLTAMLPVLSHLHVFNWTREHVRLPLADGRGYWQALVEIAAQDGVPERYAMLEFSRDDHPDNVVADLLALQDILSGA